MLVRKSRLGLLNPVTLAQEKYLSSQWGSMWLVWAVTQGGAFSNANHLRTLSEERHDGKKYWDAIHKSKLKGLVSNLKGTDKRLVLRAKSTGAWTRVRSTTVSGTVLSATEFWGFKCERYNVSPLNPERQCDRYGTAFGVTHTISWSIGGLVIAGNNRICDEILYLSQRAFTSSSVHAKPLMHQGCTRSEQEIRQGSDKDKKTWWYVMIWGLWYCQVNAIVAVKLGDADADMHKYEPMTVLLDRWENIKKDKHGKNCHDQQKHFSPFVLSVEGFLGTEALVVLSQLGRVMAEKREEPFLEVRGWVNGQSVIAVARSYSQMVHGARLPISLWEQEPD